MADSVAVFPPGYRLTDSATGAPISGATIAFFDAGTTNPQPVFADKDLTVPLGTSVVTDALGCPTSDGSAKTDIFVGTASYKAVITDASGVVIETKDNRPGAVVSAASVNVAVTALFPVVTKSLNYTVLQTDQNTIFPVNCSSGNVTITLPSAVPGTGTGNVSAAGWGIKIQHAGSANRVIIVVASGSGQTISEGSKSFGGQYVLSLNGEDIELESDGGNWRVSSHTPPFLVNAQGVIPVVSRLAASPGSPSAGQIYLLTGTGGSWSSFATGDLALYTGAAWVNFTPYSNCGWIAWVQGENRRYTYITSTWTIDSATDSAPGIQQNAVQADMEAASSTTTTVTPNRMKFHPGVAKAGARFGNSADIVSNSSFGVTSVTDNGTGDATVNLSITLSAAGVAIPQVVTFDTTGTDLGPCRVTAITTTSVRVENMIASNGSHRDPSTGYSFILFGDL
ncbi:DUF2793 domain-containing protein [Hyphomicrobium sp. ghe19]|uniref:DUF2793 domain-containing protein n=1 Tax=Hyphomicrobium sp. ghe19 TaxID=2682968 RepID=UPI00136736C1|nr:hypothetical protein HYPP_01532 [Hyphomicrobium sp. ghe19]